MGEDGEMVRLARRGDRWVVGRGTVDEMSRRCERPMSEDSGLSVCTLDSLWGWIGRSFFLERQVTFGFEIPSVPVSTL